MGQRSEVKSQSDRNLGIVVPKVLSHESPPPEPPELPHGDCTLAGRPARSPWHPGHTEGAELPLGGRRQLLHAPPARAIKGKAQNQPPPGPFRRLSPPALENHLTSPPPPGKGEERRPTPAARAAGPTVGRGPQPATPTSGSAAQERRPQEGRGPRGSCLAWCPPCAAAAAQGLVKSTPEPQAHQGRAAAGWLRAVSSPGVASPPPTLGAARTCRTHSSGGAVRRAHGAGRAVSLRARSRDSSHSPPRTSIPGGVA